jgi:hypothetical protein
VFALNLSFTISIIWIQLRRKKRTSEMWLKSLFKQIQSPHLAQQNSIHTGLFTYETLSAFDSQSRKETNILRFGLKIMALNKW